jgi:hypothetical protein
MVVSCPGICLEKHLAPEKARTRMFTVLWYQQNNTSKPKYPAIEELIQKL